MCFVRLVSGNLWNFVVYKASGWRSTKLKKFVVCTTSIYRFIKLWFTLLVAKDLRNLVGYTKIIWRSIYAIFWLTRQILRNLMVYTTSVKRCTRLCGSQDYYFNILNLWFTLKMYETMWFARLVSEDSQELCSLQGWCLKIYETLWFARTSIWRLRYLWFTWH